MSAKKLCLYLRGIAFAGPCLWLIAVGPTVAQDSQQSEIASPTSSSQVIGKGAGMGKSWQQNTTGAGHGASQKTGTGAGGGVAEIQQNGAATQPEDVRYRKARDGRGFGAAGGVQADLNSDIAADGQHNESEISGVEQ